MKTLHLIRHGKSSWDQLGVSDIDRSLIPRGISNSLHMGELIAEKYAVPDLIVSSPANRAVHTAILLARAMHANLKIIKLEKQVYEASTSTIIDIIEDTPVQVNSLAIVGHNPCFTDLANLYLPDYLENLPTTGVVTLKFDIKDWCIIDKLPNQSFIDFPKKDLF